MNSLIFNLTQDFFFKNGYKIHDFSNNNKSIIWKKAYTKYTWLVIKCFFAKNSNNTTLKCVSSIKPLDFDQTLVRGVTINKQITNKFMQDDLTTLTNKLQTLTKRSKEIAQFLTNILNGDLNATTNHKTLHPFMYLVFSLLDIDKDWKFHKFKDRYTAYKDFGDFEVIVDRGYSLYIKYPDIIDIFELHLAPFTTTRPYLKLTMIPKLLEYVKNKHVFNFNFRQNAPDKIKLAPFYILKPDNNRQLLREEFDRVYAYFNVFKTN